MKLKAFLVISLSVVVLYISANDTHAVEPAGERVADVEIYAGTSWSNAQGSDSDSATITRSVIEVQWTISQCRSPFIIYGQGPDDFYWNVGEFCSGGSPSLSGALTYPEVVSAGAYTLSIESPLNVQPENVSNAVVTLVRYEPEDENED